jgi:hypothetical protein
LTEDFEEEMNDDDQTVDRPKPRNYEITMKGPNPKEVFKYYGYLGLNPGFVLIQDPDGLMSFATEWGNVWHVKVVPDAVVYDMSTVRN